MRAWMVFVLFALLCPAGCLAQLQLSVVTGLDDKETAVAGAWDMGGGPAGAPLDVRLRIRNLGTAKVLLTLLRVTGTGFTMSGQPPLPVLMVNNANMDFSVRFVAPIAGSYAGTVVVNDATFTFTATAFAAAQLGVRDGNSSVALSTDSPYDFGQIERGQSITKRFVVRNNAAVAITVGSMSLSGAAFRSTGLPSFPLTLAPQQESSFDVICAPVLAGIQQGSITLEQRTYALTAFSVEPSFPRPLIEVDRSVPASGQQIKVSVKFGITSRVSGDGSLEVSFQPLRSGMPEDAGLQFISSGKRSVALQVKQGDTAATFNGQTSALLQTGTVAGLLQITAVVGGFKETMSLPIANALPYLDAVTTQRGDSSLQVLIAGFDNTRSADKVAFTFYDVTGAAMPWGTIRADAAQVFRSYFQSSGAGGLFLVKADFPVTGGTSSVGAVEVELSSTAGTSKSQRIRF